MTGKRDTMCPACGILMRRLYLQQVRYKEDGTRTSRFIPVGHGCLKCKSVIWDEEPATLVY